MSRSRIIKATAIIMALIMAFAGLTACGSDSKSGSGAQSGSPASDQVPGTILEETDADLTIVDQAGRTVTVKKDTQSIALCYRVVIRFLLSLDQGDKIKGIGKSEPFLEQLQPSLE